MCRVAFTHEKMLEVVSLIFMACLLLLLSGDVEKNPGPLGQHTEGKDGNKTPLLEDLVCLKVPPTKWYQLGLQLNISERELDVIKVNNPVNVDGCILEMFKTWLHNTADASYAGLGEALNRIGEHAVAAHVLQSYAAQSNSGMPIEDLTYSDEGTSLQPMHHVYESQNHRRCRELFTKNGGKITICHRTLSILDYSAIGYCMEAANDIMTKIGFRCCILTAEGLNIITEKLTHTMDNVKDFAIQDDLFDKEKLLALKRLLHKHPHVTSLDLKYCFHSRGCSDWSLLGEILRETPHLQTLNLDANEMNVDGMKAVCTAAPYLSNLQVLNLYNNKIHDDGIQVLCSAAPHLSKLQELNLSCNKIGSNGTAALWAAASHLSNLKELNLNDNNFDVTAIEALRAAAPHLSNLQVLCLSGANIGDYLTELLSAASPHWPNLKKLYLESNNLSDDSTEFLVQIMNNCPLEWLGLSGVGFWRNDFSVKGTQKLIESAKSIRPGMHLGIRKPPNYPTKPPVPPNTATSSIPMATANPPTPSATVSPLTPTTTANPPIPTTTANPPIPTTTANPPIPTTTVNPPIPTTTANPPMPTTTNNPPTPITANPPTSPNTSSASSTAIYSASETTATPPRSNTVANRRVQKCILV